MTAVVLVALTGRRSGGCAGERRYGRDVVGVGLGFPPGGGKETEGLAGEAGDFNGSGGVREEDPGIMGPGRWVFVWIRYRDGRGGGEAGGGVVFGSCMVGVLSARGCR